MPRKFDREYDVVVVGAGHAGCEAAMAASRMGCRTALISMNLDLVAQMSCNPAIGGIAKGHLVREIDAVGGIMGQIIDRVGIQFRLLNRSRGPAVRSPRAQADKALYRQEMKRTLERQQGLSLIQGEVIAVLSDNNAVSGVELLDGQRIGSHEVILTTGTFLNGLIHIGSRQYAAGRSGEPPSTHLASSLKQLGFPLGRLKTGTPPRMDGRTLDYSCMEVQVGDEQPTFFSLSSIELRQRQVPCHLTYTNERVHQIIRENLHRSPLYGGAITGIGPRYCPSIEDKVVKFPERDRHQVFIEPEGLDTHEVYLNGLSTSLPVDVQQNMIEAIPGLQHGVMVRPGYAIEYDFVPPTELDCTLQTHRLRGLFHAGQINGTTGYEEAAAQGLVAGINAARQARREEPVLFERSGSYIGILADDLVTKGIDEPYRMFTSRSEYRLLLRIDNADFRLSEMGFQIGLLDSDRYQSFCRKRALAAALHGFLRQARGKIIPAGDLIHNSGIGQEQLNSSTLEEILRRPEIGINDLQAVLSQNGFPGLSFDVLTLVETDVKYEGYIAQQHLDVEKTHRLAELKIPDDFNYSGIDGLSREIREKLSRICPKTIGQASRIPGITPAAVMILRIHLEMLLRQSRP
jgi:tRNA uridine 5-carboxymethylaminomethyl modification enzyme